MVKVPLRAAGNVLVVLVIATPGLVSVPHP